MSQRPRAPHVPTLVLFCGLPGSGKTTIAKRLEKAGRGIRLSTDDWQGALGISHRDEKFHDRLQRRLYELCGDLLDRGQDLILEDGLWFKKERDEKRRDARRHGALTEMHYFDLSFELLWHRIELRNRDPAPGVVVITDDQLQQIWSMFEPPEDPEIALYDTFIVHLDESLPVRQM